MQPVRAFFLRCAFNFHAFNFSLYWRWLYCTLICFATVLVALAGIAVFWVLSQYMQIVIVRQLAVWSVVLLLFYWIIASLWCLSDKDDYGRAVSASDDFYNVSYTAFWVIEGFLLSLFLSYSKLFDFYDPFLEADEVEATFQNEDCENDSFITILNGFITCFFLGAAVDLLLVWECSNVFYLISFFVVLLLLIIYRFFVMSVKFIEEMDIEEDGDDIFDDQDNLFEHEDFPEEATDGGDYGEGYEILQLFFGYWHYLFILLHLFYIIYGCLASSGKQTLLYWAVVAITQNILLAICLDYLEWVEVFSSLELEWVDSIYPFLYVSETATRSIKTIVSDLGQILNYLYSFFCDFCTSNNFTLREYSYDNFAPREANDFYSSIHLFVKVLCLGLLFSVWRL